MKLTELIYIHLLSYTVMVFLHAYPDSKVRVMFGGMMHLLSLLSAEIFIFLGYDIYVSIRHSLKYRIVLPLNKLRKYIAIAFNITAIAILTCYIGESAHRIQDVDFRYSTSSVIITVRLITCTTIIGFGQTTRRMRDQQARELKLRVPQFGEDAEKANIMRKMKRTIKDMATLSIFNALILIPGSGVQILVLGYSPMPFVGIDVFLSSVHAFLSPFIYTLSQKRMRKRLMLCSSNEVQSSATTSRRSISPVSGVL